MGWLTRATGRAAAAATGMLVLLSCIAGCQSGPQVSGHSLLQRQASVDACGLASARNYELVKVNCAPPQSWQQLAPNKSALYTHQQWRSPTKNTGVGVAYIHLPLPLSAKAILWFAKGEYSKKRDDGRILAEWTDEIGRPWFEAQNNKYHVRGYVLVKGFDAWIVYTGYRTTSPPQDNELNLASRCLETILPEPLVKPSSRTQTASVQ